MHKDLLLALSNRLTRIQFMFSGLLPETNSKLGLLVILNKIEQKLFLVPQFKWQGHFVTFSGIFALLKFWPIDFSCLAVLITL